MENETTESDDSNRDPTFEKEKKEAPIEIELGQDLLVVPNDFNVETIISFMKKGIIKIPSFQRHFQWKIGKSSSFIETILLGFPVPSIFLYERRGVSGNKGRFHILDGHQRLMSLYFFVKNRYPKTPEARDKIRKYMIEEGANLEELFNDAQLFEEFKLKLENTYIKEGQKLQNLTYETMEENLKESFQLSPFRITTIKESGSDTASVSTNEIYTRLNTGGETLNAQQIRAAKYDSFFYNTMYKLNYHVEWRQILKQPSVDVKMKDVEAILRTIALLADFNSHGGSMRRFLDSFSSKFFWENKKGDVELLEKIYLNFFKTAKNINFFREETNRFSVPAYESIFLFACEAAWKEKKPEKIIKIEKEKVKKFLSHKKLTDLLQEGTTSKKNINDRLKLARKILA